MNIQKVEMFHVSMELVQPFHTHLETVKERPCIILKVTDETGISGWGEVVAFSSPWYTEETVDTAWHMLEDYFIPAIFKKEWLDPRAVLDTLDSWKRNPMAKAGLEIAIWDLFAKRAKQPLAKYIGGVREVVKAGVVVGVDTPERMIHTIQTRVEEGYQRIKVKIEPAKDYKMLMKIKNAFPNVDILADANSAYTLEDIERIKNLDSLGLLMIEQPLAADDLVEHALLQKELTTPVCLDESIVSYQDAKNAIRIGSCKTMSIKIGRVGGLRNAIAIHDLCMENDIPVWCGGMLEMGISRAFNIALATLPNFTLPGDISSSDRYWKKDITFPKVVVKNGEVKVSSNPGIGVEVDEEYVKKISLRTRSFFSKTT
ncbi:o-succinylbenzoate synthase [Sutcliffiella rhizosphaerae]|uniref:o-succinylbenzoate synthase n=1 Tax=Sutcliffiella rhizosphaerae TaxID=2880967 RepID=A0ABN8AH45_9BACI|nr:o-succinylbenzoate synthase [Sutcliffiella rhizosphaerae]CAG9622403.1 o-succinylbenzoate synthase [Sutcliffiella rhizosphaerae]